MLSIKHSLPPITNRHLKLHTVTLIAARHSIYLSAYNPIWQFFLGGGAVKLHADSSADDLLSQKTEKRREGDGERMRGDGETEGSKSDHPGVDL